MDTEGKRELRLLGDAIRAKRTALALSQEDFAELANLHRTYIGQLERGEKNVSAVNLLRLSKAFKIKPSILFKDAGL